MSVTLAGKTKIVSWTCQIVAAVILGQTLFFKFSGAEESIYIFEQINAEPWGRIASGLGELLAVVLLLIPRTAGVGGLLGMGLMLGAIGAHLTKLGVVVQDDRGLLFGLALTTFTACVVTAFLRRKELPLLGSLFRMSLPKSPSEADDRSRTVQKLDRGRVRQTSDSERQ